MKKKSAFLSNEDIALFRQATAGTKKLRQDTLQLSRIRPSLNKYRELYRQIQESSQNNFYFSDEFQPLLQDEGPIRFLRANADPWQLKKLRRGDYTPELFLDLHGLTQQQSKQELAALIFACLQENICCACVMHGHGKQILKRQVPLWLAQHPDILAFHQAPKIWGGNAALLLLITTDLCC